MLYVIARGEYSVGMAISFWRCFVKMDSDINTSSSEVSAF